MCVVCVRGFSEGVQGGAQGRHSQGWHREGVHQGLAMAWVLQLLGARMRREVHSLSGAGGGAHKVRGKKNEKRVTYSSTHKNVTCSSCCACTADVWAGSLWGWLEASWMQQNLAECNNYAASRDRH